MCFGCALGCALVYLHYRCACGHVDEGTCPHQVLAATLTLSQPGGADYAHPILVSTPSFESHRRACNTGCGASSVSIQKYSNSRLPNKQGG